MTAQRQVSESAIWDIGSQVAAMRRDGREPAEIRVSPTVKRLLDRAVNGFDVATLADVPVVLVEHAAPTYWEVLPRPEPTTVQWRKLGEPMMGMD